MPDVSVPIIPSNFTPVGTMVKPVQQTGLGAMSLGDIVNMARGVQEYQQRQQLNPIEIQRQQAALDVDKLNLLHKRTTHAVQNLQDLLAVPNLTAQEVVERAKEVNANQGGDETSLKQGLIGLPMNGSPTQIKAWLGRKLVSNLEAQAQVEKLYPNVAQTNVGGQVVPIAQGNPMLAAQQPGQQTGPGVATSISPQVFPEPITGQPMVIGGGGGPVGGAPMPQQNAPAAPPAGGAPRQPAPQPSQQAPAAGGGVARPILMPQFGLDSEGNMKQGPNESPANFNARVADAQNSYREAVALSSDPSVKGYIPNIQQINKNVLDLLKDKNVDTGAVASYLAGKTNKGALNSKEQELTKYLAQRIQNINPRSDADAESKREAYGTFNLTKDALKSLVRQDNVWVTTQDLVNKGIKNNGLNPNNPSNPAYGRVQVFRSLITPYTSNVPLMTYISYVGEGKRTKLDSDDIAAFNKFIAPMSQEERNKLEVQRQEVLKLINPRRGE